MLVRDFPLEKIDLGLRIRSLACDTIFGTVVKSEIIKGRMYYWVQWDNDSRIYSGFFLNNCDCEVV